MLESAKLVSRYITFALIATSANIGTQDLVVRLQPDRSGIVISVMVGTIVGLLVKYVFDKRYIFRFYPRSTLHDTQIFFLYCLMGLITTAVFWGFEFGFHAAFDSKGMRYLGGVMGLAIGYLAKYHLDKRYVFHGVST